MTNEYSEVAKEIANGDLSKSKRFEELQQEILDQYQEEIEEKVSEIRGVDVKFNPPYIGSWQGKYEPSLNMTLLISDDVDSGALSGLLYDLAENTSQDAFILEEESEITDRLPLTETDENGIMHYPQVRVEFEKQLTTEEKSIIAQALNKNGVNGFSIDGDYFIVSIIDLNSETDEQRNRFYQNTYEAATSPFGGEGARIGTNKVRGVQENIRASRYVAARNEGDEQS